MSVPTYVPSEYYPNMGSAQERWARNNDTDHYPNQGSEIWSGGGAAPFDPGDALLMPSGDFILQPSGDKILIA